jgi:hypothetical protein
MRRRHDGAAHRVANDRVIREGTRIPFVFHVLVLKTEDEPSVSDPTTRRPIGDHEGLHDAPYPSALLTGSRSLGLETPYPRVFNKRGGQGVSEPDPIPCSET